MAGFISERVAGFTLECLAGFIGIRMLAKLLPQCAVGGCHIGEAPIVKKEEFDRAMVLSSRAWRRSPRASASASNRRGT
jgi:hypothetical protein